MKINFWMVFGLMGLLGCSYAAGQSGVAQSQNPHPATIAPAVPRPPRSDYSAKRRLLISLHQGGALTDEELAKAEDKLFAVTVFSARELDRRPAPVSEVIPELSGLRQINGTFDLVIDYIVAADGSVQHVRELGGVPGEIALLWIQAARGWRYSPGIKDGQPVATELQRRLRISLNHTSTSNSSQPNFSSNSFSTVR